ncbi:MAG: hypothetical protein ACXVFL_02160 [Solirubrobacteraceae bacterium]
MLTATDTSSRRRIALAVPVGVVLVAALSLVAADQATYDPWAWMIWGREIVHGDLSTLAGPTWKPLPVLVTAPTALFGDLAPRLVWLAVARAAFLAALVLAFVVTRRLAGTLAGLLAAGALLLTDKLLFYSAMGNSEGLLAALLLAAVQRHLAGRLRQAFAALFLAALLRPEIWPFLAAYGLWCAWRDWGTERRRWTLALVGGGGAAVLLLWFVPDYIGSGSLLRGASRARAPVAGTPAQASHPFATAIADAAATQMWLTFAGVALALLLAWRTPRRSAVLLIGAVAAANLVLVAVLAQGGFTGNPRYATGPIALLCVLGGAGWAWAWRWLRARARPALAWGAAALAVAVALPFVVPAVEHTRVEARDVRRQSRIYGELPSVIASLGGPAGVRRCGKVYTGPLQTQMLAWYMHVHPITIGIEPAPPGRIVAPYYAGVQEAQGFPHHAAVGRWTIRSSC